MMRFLGVLLGMMAGSVAGCSGTSTDRTDCPRVVLDRATSFLTHFREPRGGHELVAEITGYNGTCEHHSDHLVMTLAVRFTAMRGPALTAQPAQEDPAVTWPYFVAIVHTPPSAALAPPQQPTVLAKEIFHLASTFPSGQDSIHVRDEDITLALPLKPGESLDRYQIFLGFQLTAEQLNDNRQKAGRGG